jgi:hypothetical protein
LWNGPDQDVVHNMRIHWEQSQGVFPVAPWVFAGHRVSNWATINHPTIPQPWNGEPFRVPETCVAWHANWTIGVENKWAMLEEARRQMDAQASS